MSLTDAARAASCTATSDDLAEPLDASAGVARSWLLVEHPGPWKRDPFATGFDTGVMAELQERLAGSDTKILAIRRADTAATGRRRIVVAHSGPGDATVATTEVGHESELLEIDLHQLDSGTGPLYLVCTHAGRDACCGRLGRPLADSLEPTRPGRVWECSHVGGHRFAANLVCLPHGVLYGRVDTAAGDGTRLGDAYEDGRLDLAHLRGVSWQEPPVQAADLFLRRHTGLTGIGDVTPERAVDIGETGWRVELRTPSGTWQAHVRLVPTGKPRPISCGTDELEDPGRWELAGLIPEGD